MTITEEARRERIEAAVNAHDPATEESVRIHWRGEDRIFPVVSLGLDSVVLNPNSHRIQAQLESLDTDGLVRDDPFSDEAQELIASILREEVEGFEDLRNNLAEDRQKSPGVITRVGLLVNANRRTVALRDNGQRYIRVAVLPDATADEVSDLELALQMQRDFREDYSFTNRLLFVDDLLTKQGREIDDVTRALNVAASSDERAMVRGRAKVEQDTRVLILIRDIQGRSGDRIPLTEFDEQEIALEELERSYRETAQDDPEAAERLRETRVLGILAEVPYRDLRRFDGEVLDEYVLPQLEDDELFAEVLPALRQRAADEDLADPGGLDVLEESAEEEGQEEHTDDEDAPLSGSAQVSALVDLFATTHGETEIELPTENGERKELRETVVSGMNAALRSAASDIESDRREENRLLRPYNRVIEADRKLKAASEALARVLGEPELDPEPIRRALESVQGRVDDLKQDLDQSS